MTKRKNQPHILKLVESEIEKAEIVLATRNEIVDKLQRDAEKISNMKVDILSPLVDRVKAEHGLEAADKFRESIEGKLDLLLTTIMDVKDQISTEVLRLTGDISSAPDIAGLGDTSDTGLGDGFDLSADAGLGEVGLDDAPLATEPVPDERGMKESATRGEYVAIVETYDRQVGKKYKKTKAELDEWLETNKSKILKVHKAGRV